MNDKTTAEQDADFSEALYELWVDEREYLLWVGSATDYVQEMSRKDMLLMAGVLDILRN